MAKDTDFGEIEVKLSNQNRKAASHTINSDVKQEITTSSTEINNIKQKNVTNHAKIDTTKRKKSKLSKKQKVYLIIITIIVLAIAAIFVRIFVIKPQISATHGERVEFPEPIYSKLSGEIISSEEQNSLPTYCVQIPNGLDGARPQAGLNGAVIVFEAIAEAGITRFAAIFQNPSVSAIGPIRSLRPYYLDWDTPFDCTVVHAGGSAEAIAAIRQGGQRDHDENLTYMWRETGNVRMWNNLFTSPSDLANFNRDRGYNTSTPKTFPRLTPDEETDILTEQKRQAKCAEESCEQPTNLVSKISINLGGNPNFNPVYHYNAEENRYARSYATSEAHTTYSCDSQLERPNTLRDCGTPSQIAPKVVIAMHVRESKMADNYHENITTIGSGTVEIFQNGTVTKGTWSKTSQTSQIEFRDENGEIIKLTPGQTWITAVPQYGNVEY